MYAIRSYYEEQELRTSEENLRDYQEREKVASLDKETTEFVITSYSIHYTKLYELFLMRVKSLILNPLDLPPVIRCAWKKKCIFMAMILTRPQTRLKQG